MPFKTIILSGDVDLGPVGMKVMGGLWLAAGLSFLATSVATALGTAAWPGIALATISLSTLLSVLAWPDARIGVFLNIALAIFLLVARRQAWF